MHKKGPPHWKYSNVLMMSTIPGTIAWVPGTSAFVEIIDMSVRVIDCENLGANGVPRIQDVSVGNNQVCRKFNVICNISSGRVYAHMKVGHNDDLVWIIRRANLGLEVISRGCVKTKVFVDLSPNNCSYHTLNLSTNKIPGLTLGNHKQRDVNKILFRLDPKEILPICFGVQHITLLMKERGLIDLNLYNSLKQDMGYPISLEERLTVICMWWRKYLKGCFVFSKSSNVSVNDYNGLYINGALWALMADVVHDLFYKVDKTGSIYILPATQDIKSGRFSNVYIPQFGCILDVIWRKNRVVRVTILSTRSVDIPITIEKATKCRCTYFKEDRSIVIPMQGSIVIENALGKVVLDKICY